jgi:hypothetical protein
MRPLKLEGQRFGYLTVQTRSTSRPGKSRWTCLCVCGVTCTVIGSQLTSGKTRSCGCLKLKKLQKPRKHGQAIRGKHTRTYKIWRGLFKRCYVKNFKYYNRYGGRGIEVDPRWFDFCVFYEAMGECPPGKTLERVNNNRNYWKGNCVWACRTTQARNTSKNRLVTYQGQTKCVAEWAALYDLSHSLVLQRLTRLNWSVERAITTPPRAIRSGIRRNCYDD